jgi:hypothetical protein
MRCEYSCKSSEHTMGRRAFLGGMAAGTGAVVGGLGALARPSAAAELTKTQKRVVVFNMAGGLSQLESWDPKPGTNTGGPFLTIPTSVPGLHISELLPYTAKQMHNLAIVRSINTKEGDHGRGHHAMFTGRKQTPGADYPVIGAVMAKNLESAANSLPGHIVVSPGGGGGRGNDAAYLGPRYSSITLDSGKPPQNSARPADITEAADAARQAFRRGANDNFALRRKTAQTDAYVQSYEQALELMRRGEVFDTTKEPEKDHERYGKHDFGRHCLLARRLLESGVTFVQVTHTNYDTHNENFDFHLEQLGEWDRPFATLVEDIAARGMLDSTLIIVLSEFGRTPNINHLYGRDHWGNAWSVCLGGAKIARGAVIGKTNDNGTAVSDREVDHGHMFHTYLSALGLDSTQPFDIAGRQIPMADPAYGPIKELIV